jgi:hypothetical protein
LGKAETMESVLLNPLLPMPMTSVQVQQRETVKSVLKGGYSYPASAASQSTILNAMLEGPQPKTFSVANATRLATLKPWSKAVILRDLGKSCLDPRDPDCITSLELLSIAFQLIWTLAALCKAFPGFQHNSLPISVKLYAYAAPRCYRLSTSSDLAYYIPAGCPLPIIVNWSTADCTCDSPIPYRNGPSDDGKDVNDMLDAMLTGVSRELPPKLFKPLLKIKDYCTNQVIRYKRAPNGRLEADKSREGNRACIPMILMPEVHTTVLVSSFFDEFSEPIQTPHIALLDGF